MSTPGNVLQVVTDANRGWGTTNQPDRNCCNCNNRKAGCYSWYYWYAPYDSDNNFTMGEFTQNCLGWETKLANVDGVPMRFVYDPSCCGDQTVDVLGANNTPIGRVVQYRYLCGWTLHDRVWLEGLTAEGKSEFTLWQPGCCTCRPCSCGECRGPCGHCTSCCGYIEQDYIIHGPREAGIETWRATLTYRYHTCHQYYPRWFGYRAWPEGSNPTSKALLVGIAHTLNPLIR